MRQMMHTYKSSASSHAAWVYAIWATYHSIDLINLGTHWLLKGHLMWANRWNLLINQAALIADAFVWLPEHLMVAIQVDLSNLRMCTRCKVLFLAHLSRSFLHGWLASQWNLKIRDLNIVFIAAIGILLLADTLPLTRWQQATGAKWPTWLSLNFRCDSAVLQYAQFSLPELK